MNRLQKLLNSKKQNILSIYFTAGYPKLDSTEEILYSLEKNGVDLVEIGIPFSDPLADGAVIQASSQQALQNGMNLELLLSQLEQIRPKTELPFVLMGYFNPIYQYGVEKLVKTCAESGVDALIIPDLPIDEYQEKYQAIFKKYGVSLIFLLTPQTNEKRLKLIDNLSTSFIYAVSSASTTGSKLDFDSNKINYFNKLKNAKLKHPFIIGFGISDNESFAKACEYANGAIIGSAFIKAINKSENLSEDVGAFIQKIR